MAPIDEDLLRLALGEKPLQADVKEHLEQCATCQQRLALYTRTNNYLLSMLYRSQCPTTMKLNLYCDNKLRGDEEKAIAHHLTRCPLCADEVALLRCVLADFEPFPEASS